MIRAMLGCSSAQKGMSMPTKIRFFVGLAGLCGVVVLASSCGGSKSAEETSTSAGTTTTIPTPSVDSKVAAEVPADIKSKGTLTVAADATYAPNEFIGSDGKTVVGMDADLAQGARRRDGAQGEGRQRDLRHDHPRPRSRASTTSACRPSPTRRSARRSSTSSPTSRRAPRSTSRRRRPTINSARRPLRPHGRASSRGRPRRPTRNAQDTKCKAAGKSGVNVHVFPDQNAANLALSSGRAEVGMADSPVAAYIVKQSNGQFKLTGKPYDTAPYGIAIPKGNGLAKPVLDAREGADGERHVQGDPDEVGHRSPARSRTRRSTARRASRDDLGRRVGSSSVAAAVRRHRHRRRDPPEEIKAIPVRHPGRWVAAAVIVLRRRRRRGLDGDQQPLPVGDRRPLLLLAAASSTGSS